MSSNTAPSATTVNSCPSCGGQMSFDPETGGLKCLYCEAQKAIVDRPLEVVENPFKEALGEGMRSWAEEDIKAISCKNCGAELIFDAHTKAQFCTYCGSSHISEHAPEKTIPPGYVVPFKIDEKSALGRFKTWIGKRWFAPNALKTAYQSNRLVGSYIPYWTFDTQTFSRYTAERGDYYYVTKTRVVNGKTETYQERHTRWTSVRGDYQKFYDDVLIPASDKVDHQMLDRADDFHIDEMVMYQSDYLSGFIAERYSIDLEKGWELGKNNIDQMLNTEIRHAIGGDEVRSLRIETHYDDLTFKHLLLPLWMSTYQFQSKLYHFIINGQTGTVHGNYPKSPVKIALAVLLGIVILVVGYILIANQTQLT